jgi:hypothetical protein
MITSRQNYADDYRRSFITEKLPFGKDGEVSPSALTWGTSYNSFAINRMPSKRLSSDNEFTGLHSPFP